MNTKVIYNLKDSVVFYLHPFIQLKNIPYEYYRFWSLDPIYKNITDLIKNEGLPIGNADLHRGIKLYEGDVYSFGLALGRKYKLDSILI
ncbi:MAG: hypothetical protein Q7S27_01280 [Nanoarchaeota archaeon]|nr:hypothetical protein [Nanoarchaeota archaeon]